MPASSVLETRRAWHAAPARGEVLYLLVHSGRPCSRERRSCVGVGVDRAACGPGKRTLMTVRSSFSRKGVQ